MSKVNLNKKALHKFHNKYVVLADFSLCESFISKPFWTLLRLAYGLGFSCKFIFHIKMSLSLDFDMQIYMSHSNKYLLESIVLLCELPFTKTVMNYYHSIIFLDYYMILVSLFLIMKVIWSLMKSNILGKLFTTLQPSWRLESSC
jgi:hypothetical protein